MPKQVAEQITWRDVSSSNVDAIGWDKDANMYVRFKGGGLYMYPQVSRQRAVAAVRAGSVGAYINRVIKQNFKAVRIA